MKRYILAVTFLIFTFNAKAIEFEKISIKGYEKKIISEKQIRFVKSDNPKKAIHLQVSTYDPQHTWKQETLKKEIVEMFDTREKMLKIFGFHDIQFYDYKLLSLKKLPQLNIFGTYKKIDNKKVYFAETNVYFSQEFLQVKVISEQLDGQDKNKDKIKDKNNISEKEMEMLLAEIKADELQLR
jgi:hypothetical protein